MPRAGQDGTWITAGDAEAYVSLHRAGFAHSFETFLEGELVGGLYGVSLGAAFFGESMFSRVDYASRAAFQSLCDLAWGWGFHFIDGQLPNDNLKQLGAVGPWTAKLPGPLEPPRWQEATHRGLLDAAR